MSLHLRIEGSRLYRGAVTCSCGVPGCTAWHAAALEAVRHAPAVRARDRAQMVARLDAFEREQAIGA